MADYTVMLLQYVVSKAMTSRAEQNRFPSANNQILITQNLNLAGSHTALGPTNMADDEQKGVM